jgi:hypothetical protein
MMLAIVVCLVTAAGAPADQDAPPCLADTKRFCGQVPPTGSFVQGCLQAHAANLSAACRKRVGQVTRDGEKLTTACRSDLARLCADTPLAAGARETCLVGHRDALSSECRETLEKQSSE